jgi:hypothetical protein
VAASSAVPDAVLASASKYDAWVWKRVASGKQPELGTTYRQFRSPESAEALTFSTVISNTDPLAVISSRTAGWRSWHIAAGRVGAMLVNDDVGDSFVVTSWPDARSEIYHLAATVPATDRRWLRFGRWLASSAPRVIPVYLDRGDFEGFVSVLAEHGEVDASRLTGRYRSDQSSYSRGWPNPKSARAALEEIADEVQLRTMTLSVLSVPEAEILLRVHLRRAAGATFYSGDFDLFQSVVLERLAAAASRRVQLFRNRFRTLEHRAVRPIEVKVGVARFDGSVTIVDFLERVSRYSFSDTAVLHRNPYVQVALTDYLDGSNFDLFVTAVDRITIYPGYQATVSALVRLTDFLSEEFEADGVADVATTSPAALEDLFAPG